ncbi:MAG TPA: hypothetical protein VL306_03165 [Methylomirabilota bacterium]|nr:hypothetical protein [Methylomirabilota bacterium]
MEKHFVCPVCGGVSATEKRCDTNGCKAHGQPLRACTCIDSRHNDILGSGDQATV